MKLFRSTLDAREADYDYSVRFGWLNFRRIAVLSVLILAAQLAAAIVPCGNSARLTAFHIAVAVLAAAFAALGAYALKRKGCLRRMRQAVARSFWFFFALSMLPFYIAPRLASAQMLAAVACAVMILAQIHSARQILCYFAFHTAVGVCAAILANADAQMYVAMLLLNGVCLLIALSIHENVARIMDDLYRDAQTDDLTGLLNHGAGMRRLRTLWKHCARMQGACAALMMDIDFFKSYNDAFGHLQGDTVLVDVAGVLLASFGRATDIVCRYGGEEFLVCAVVRDEEEALSLAKTAIRRVEELKIRTIPNGVSDCITISVGVSVGVPQKDRTERALVEDADVNLYVAKSGGRNCAAIGGRLAE